MARIMVHVEGLTEETFVREVLAPHLLAFGHDLSARLLGNARQRHKRGGITGWDSVSREILRQLKEDSACVVTTMVDYYALPQSGSKAWPGRVSSNIDSLGKRATVLKGELHADIARRMGPNFDSGRFIPFVVFHEFEALLFSDCRAFAFGIGQPKLEKSFLDVLSKFDNPEEINDSPQTAPSKRVQAIFPAYQKPIMGTLAICEMGLGKIRSECPIFNEWITALECTR